MNTTDIVNAIDGWKNACGGLCPSFSDLHKLIKGDSADLQEELEKAEELGIVYQPQVGLYDYRPDMI